MLLRFSVMSPIITNNINFSKQHSLLARACNLCLSPLAQACSLCPPRKLALFLKTTLPPSDSSNPSNLSDLSNSSNPSASPSDSLRFSKSLPLPHHRYTLPKFLARAARTPITALAARTILPRKLANSQIITTFAPENSK